MDENILKIYKMQIERLTDDNRRLRRENARMSRILEAIKMYFMV